MTRVRQICASSTTWWWWWWWWWLHRLDVNKTIGEKAKWEIQKDAMCCFEQILEASLYKIIVVLPLLISQTIQERRAKHAGHCQANKNEFISDFLWTLTHGHTSVGRPVKTYIEQNSAEHGCRLENLSSACQSHPRCRHVLMIMMRISALTSTQINRRFHFHIVYGIKGNFST